MALKAKKPKKDEPKRLKFFMYGPAGVGKTIACLQLFPKAVVIDTEHGCNHYGDLIASQGSAVLQTHDVDEITSELRALYTESHDFTSVIIDPVTIVYQELQEKWAHIFRAQAIRKNKTEQVETEDWGFGFWGKVKRDYKRMLTLLDKLDMNVVMTSHQKDLYSNDGSAPKKIGVTFDAMKGADYFFDTVFRLYKSGDKRFAETVKQRAFPNAVFDDKFEWVPEKIREVWGIEAIEKKAETVELATPEQVKRLARLVELTQTDDATVTKWNDKAGAETWADYPADNAAKCIAFLEKKLPEDLRGGAA